MTDSQQPPIPPYSQGPEVVTPPPTTRRQENVPAIVVSWIVIIAIVLFIAVVVPLIGLRQHIRESKKATTNRAQRVEPEGNDLTLRIMSRYAVGWKALGSQVASEADVGRMIIPQVVGTAKTPIDRIKAATVIAELEGPKRAVDLIQQNKPKVSKPIQADAQRLLEIYRDGAKITDEDRKQLPRDLGWFGELAAAYRQPDTDPNRQHVMALAKRTSIVLVGALIGVVSALIAGAVLLIVALILYFTGRVRTKYLPPMTISGPFVEAFALYLLLFMGGSIVIGLLTHGTSLAWSLVLTILLPLAWLWPRFRGVPSDEVWRGLGWHTGSGFFTEIGCGLLGYITGLPVIAVGMFFVWILVLVSKATPTHPIQFELSTEPMRVFELYLIASIWAPIFEETMFRGALFNFMRGRFRWLFSASVVAFIFAVIHPQGWTTVPALFAIALVLAGIREWRGSIIGSMTAHALHNGILVTILIFAVG